MFLSRIVLSALAFSGALTIGVGVEPVVESAPSTTGSAVKLAPIRSENLLGRWTGTWGRDRAACTLDIQRVDGDKFYGTLTKEGTVVLFEGTLDAGERAVSFEEIKIVKLGPDMPSWSLGVNTGSFSVDGHVLTGTGQDKHSRYGWDAVKE